jgi:hypothetical protein
MEDMDDLKLVEVKILYDMLEFLLKYYLRFISIKLPDQVYYELKVFEEAVGLLGSSSHTIHVRSKGHIPFIRDKLDDQEREFLPEEVKNNQRNILQFLTDSNQHRTISRVYRLTPKRKLTFELERNLNSFREPEFFIGNTINYYLRTRSDVLKQSTNKLMEQHKSYEDSIELYKLRTNQVTSLDGKVESFMDGSAWIIAQLEIKGSEEPWLKYLREEL